MAESMPDAYHATAGKARLPPEVVRSFVRAPETSHAEHEAEQLTHEIRGLFIDHGIPLTDELIAAAGDLALAAVLTRQHPK
jgi:hypothetical protein